MFSLEPYRYLRFNLPPPNEDVDHICYLVFGRWEYDSEVTQYYIELNKWWRNDKDGPKPTHWRQRVRDQWASINIWVDPESQPSLDNGYQRTKLYDPMQLQDMLLDSPRIIKTVHATIEADGSGTAMRRLQRELLSFFRNEFKQVSTGNWDRTFKFLEAAVDIIAQSLLLNYELYPLEWSTRVMQHGEPSQQWLDHVERVDAVLLVSSGQGPNRKIERVSEPAIVKGLIYDE